LRIYTLWGRKRLLHCVANFWLKSLYPLQGYNKSNIFIQAIFNNSGIRASFKSGHSTRKSKLLIVFRCDCLSFYKRDHLSQTISQSFKWRESQSSSFRPSKFSETSRTSVISTLLTFWGNCLCRIFHPMFGVCVFCIQFSAKGFFPRRGI